MHIYMPILGGAMMSSKTVKSCEAETAPSSLGSGGTGRPAWSLALQDLLDATERVGLLREEHRHLKEVLRLTRHALDCERGRCAQFEGGHASDKQARLFDQACKEAEWTERKHAALCEAERAAKDAEERYVRLLGEAFPGLPKAEVTA